MVSLAEEFFGLHRTPFPISGKSGSVLVTRPLRDVAEALKRDLEDDARVICVAGAPGVGKTSFFRSLPRLVQGDVLFALLPDHTASWEAMLETIIRELRLPDGRLSRNALLTARLRGSRLVLVVDDAHRLDPKSLDRIAVLSRLHGIADEPLVHVVFFADLAEVRARMETSLLAWLDARHCHELGPMPVEGVHAYLHTRMRRAGWEGEPLFTREAGVLLHHRARGNPRALAIASLECLECAAERGLRRIDDAFVFEIYGEHVSAEPASIHTPQPMPPTPTAASAHEGFHVRATTPIGESPKRPAEVSPLTAESILDSASLDLVGHAPASSPAHESQHFQMRSVARPAAASTAGVVRFPIIQPRRRHGWKWFGALVVLIGVALFAGRHELRSLTGGLEDMMPALEFPTALQWESLWPSPERGEGDFAVSAPPPRE